MAQSTRTRFREASQSIMHRASDMENSAARLARALSEGATYQEVIASYVIMLADIEALNVDFDHLGNAFEAYVEKRKQT